MSPNTKQSDGNGCLFPLIPPALAVLVMLGLMLLTSRTDTPPAPSSDNAAPLAAFFTPEVVRWQPEIMRWADLYELDPNLIATVMQIESCGNPQAVSQAGALGLFQVMPYHFEDGEDPFDPQTNARRGLGYLKTALTAAQNDVALALAAYNGGTSVLSQPAANWPAETQSYAYWGAQIYADAHSGQQVSPRLNEWLAHGGDNLCRAARSVHLP